MWVRERSGRALQGSMNLSKCQERASKPGHEVFILPLPLLAVKSKRVPHGLSAMPSRTVRVWIPTVKTWRQLLSELPVAPGGLSAMTPRTVHHGLTDRPRVGRRPSAQTSRVAHNSVCFEVNFKLSALDPWTVLPEAIFSWKTFPKTSDLK
jgi:hypothetical protein